MKSLKNAVLTMIMFVTMAVFNLCAADSQVANCHQDNSLPDVDKNCLAATESIVKQPTVFISPATLDTINRDPVNPFSERADLDIPVTESAGMTQTDNFKHTSISGNN
jgi:hypothetical protein